MKIKLTLLAILLASVMFSSFTINRSMLDPWVQLGMLKVDYALDHDVLPVTYRKGYFEAVKIVVRGGPLHMHKCMVYFENGGQQEVELRHNFAKGTESRVVDLKGNKRFIERIEFWYDTKDIADRKALIVVWGRK
jgi:hypothetical protein